MSSRYPNDNRGRDFDRGRDGFRPDTSYRPHPASHISPRSPRYDYDDRRRPTSPPRYSERPEPRGRRSSSGDRMSRSYDRSYDPPRGKSRARSKSRGGNSGDRTPNPYYHQPPASPGPRTTDTYGPPRPQTNSRVDDRDAPPALLRRIEGGEDAGRKGNAGNAGSGSGGNRQSWVAISLRYFAF
jgi:hypothetical protein